MTDDTKRQENLDLARSDPGKLYDQSYYAAGYDENDDTPYGRHEPWLSLFKGMARKIDRTFHPRTAIDIGCAHGLLVEALNDRGIDAFGVDVSEYAVSQARDDMKDRIQMHSIENPVPLYKNKDGSTSKYDIAICVEMLEHLPEELCETAIDHICAASDRVLFSSTPDGFDEPTHFNVLPTDTWLEKFAQRGFVPSTTLFEATFVAPQARIVERPGTPLGKKRGLLSKLFR